MEIIILVLFRRRLVANRTTPKHRKKSHHATNNRNLRKFFINKSQKNRWQNETKRYELQSKKQSEPKFSHNRVERAKHSKKFFTCKVLLWVGLGSVRLGWFGDVLDSLGMFCPVLGIFWDRFGGSTGRAGRSRDSTGFDWLRYSCRR